MKMNLKPWQIGVCCAAGIAVLGGAGTGIYFGVNRAIDNKVKDQVDAAMESVYSSEVALDESETPTQAAGETTTEGTTAAPPTKEPETVLVYIEPSTEEKITFKYDAALSREVALLLQEKFSDAVYDDSLKRDIHPENFINLYYNKVSDNNDATLYTGKENTAEEIVNAWTACDPLFGLYDSNHFSVQSYRYSNGYTASFVIK